MINFRKITTENGFDRTDLNNGRQNNYAWSMAELGNHIYVGTGRNVIPLFLSVLVNPNIQAPILVKPPVLDMNAEIWRYKKDDSDNFKRVYKATTADNINGFRYMINHHSNNSSEALYASGVGTKVTILKSTNGISWFKLNTANLIGTSSRAMASLNGKLYIATIEEGLGGDVPYLYSSTDPEFTPFELVFDSSNPNYNRNKNPRGGINDLIVFNNSLYVCTSGEEGIEVWKSNSNIPQLNDWTLIVDKGFGDAANTNTLAVGIFNNHLYISGSKSIPLAWAIPYGFDMIRVDKENNWELIVGGPPLRPTTPTKGKRNIALSGYPSGFGNPFNVYGWQIKEFNNQLIVTTFDDSSNMEVIRDLLLLNRAALSARFGELLVSLAIKAYNFVLFALEKLNYPVGFDTFISDNGINFRPISLNGLGNKTNYGGRTLMVDSTRKNLYLGTANPFMGCEVYKAYNKGHCSFMSCNYNTSYNYSKLFDRSNPSSLEFLKSLNLIADFWNKVKDKII